MTVPPLFRLAQALLRPHRARVALGLVCVPAAAAALLAIPMLVGHAVDLAASDGAIGPRWRTLLELAAAVGLCGIAEAGLRYTARRLLIDASRGAEATLKDRLMHRLLRLPATWFDRARTGDVISRFTQDVELVRFVVGPALLHGGASLVVVPGAIYLMASLSASVCLAATLSFGILLGGLAILLPRLHRHSTAAQEAIGAISQRAAEDFGGVRVLLTFGRAPIEAEAMRQLADAYLGHNVGLARVRAWINLLIHTSRELVVLAVLVFGAREAMAGRLTVGELVQFLGLTSIVVWPLLAASWIAAVVQRAFAAAARIDELLQATPEQDGELELRVRGALEVRDLSYTYPDSPRPALAGIDLRLQPGQTLGLVGSIGSGKSTLLALLTLLYRPPPGTVFLDGEDVLRLRRDTVRSAFACAPQDPFLFGDAVRDNIAFGGGDPAAVAAAVHTSAVDQDLDAYPQGLDSIVGERGVTLSGGQKQRVSLARALAADRPVLVLDDTLSAVDHRTEARILDRLRIHRPAQTRIIASHRLSAVAAADEILVLDGGRIVERGTHEELLRRGGQYAAIAALQRDRARDQLE